MAALLLNSLQTTLTAFCYKSLDMLFDSTKPYDTVNMSRVDFPYTFHGRNDTVQLPIQQPQAEEGVQSETRKVEQGHGDVLALSASNTFEIVSTNIHNDNEEWNIRSDYEEKDNVYYMPTGTYRSYELGYWKKDGKERQNVDVKARAEDQSISNGFDIVSRDKNDSENWNIRSDYEEKDVVYQMPPGTYRSYELGYWKKDDHESGMSVDGNRNVSKGQVARSNEAYGDSINETDSVLKDYIDDCKDFATPQSLANVPHVPNGKVKRRLLCRVCRLCSDVQHKKIGGSKRNGIWVLRKLLAWRRKPRNVRCAKCGCGIERISLLRKTANMITKADDKQWS